MSMTFSLPSLPDTVVMISLILSGLSILKALRRNFIIIYQKFLAMRQTGKVQTSFEVSSLQRDETAGEIHELFAQGFIPVLLSALRNPKLLGIAEGILMPLRKSNFWINLLRQAAPFLEELTKLGKQVNDQVSSGPNRRDPGA